MRAALEVMADNCLGLAAQLAYYFFLALFPALLFIVALVSFLPVQGLLHAITGMLGRVAPGEALSLIQEQIVKIASGKDGGLLTLGMIGTIWSTSSGMTAIIDTLNQAYDIQESRPWWKVRLIAVGLTNRAGGLYRRVLRARDRRTDARRKSGGLGAHGPGVRVDVEDPVIAYFKLRSRMNQLES